MKPAIKYCAVYTRKSTEEGLEQDFNSLDAQREACLSYIASQKAEGWVPVLEEYDDGGFSGGTLERPALKRLLEDIKAEKINTVVVYKIDRLTRALMDFSKLVEVFDQHGVTFISITQSFNTTTSMGRLTLNVLLSFAQFEREVIGERVRDKIAASKKKGMWMGGTIPLGYQAENRQLVPNEAEVKTVRHIFDRYWLSGTSTTFNKNWSERIYTARKGSVKMDTKQEVFPSAAGPCMHFYQTLFISDRYAIKTKLMTGSTMELLIQKYGKKRRSFSKKMRL